MEHCIPMSILHSNGNMAYLDQDCNNTNEYLSIIEKGMSNSILAIFCSFFLYLKSCTLQGQRAITF